MLKYAGRGHTAGDIVAWLPRQKILFAGDLVEAQAALYTGDAFHPTGRPEPSTGSRRCGADQLVGGRGESPRAGKASTPPSADPRLPHDHAA